MRELKASLQRSLAGKRWCLDVPLTAPCQLFLCTLLCCGPGLHSSHCHRPGLALSTGSALWAWRVSRPRPLSLPALQVSVMSFREDTRFDRTWKNRHRVWEGQEEARNHIWLFEHRPMTASVSVAPSLTRSLSVPGLMVSGLMAAERPPPPGEAEWCSETA